MRGRGRTSRRDEAALFVLIVSTMIAGALPAAADPCDPVSAALIKLAQTPNHSFTEESGAIAGGGTRQHERIATATAAYVRVSGKWRRSVLPPKKVLELQNEMLNETKKASCRFLGEEAIEGEPAALYLAQHADDSGKSDNQIWISKRRGLPLKQVTHLAVGGGKAGESQMTTRYVYDDVHAPEGVQ